MSTKIRDLVDIVPVADRTGPARLSTFLLSYEIGDALARTVERIAASGPGPHNALVVGGPGCGKSRLLDATATLLEVDASVELHPRLKEIRSAAAGRKMLVVRVPDDKTEPRLSAALEKAAIEQFTAAGYVPPNAGSGSRVDAVARAVAALPDRCRVVFVIDDLDRWLDTATRYALENTHALVRLGELSRDIELSVCAAAGEYVLLHESGASGHGWITALLDTYRIEYVPARALRTATASNVLSKNARQRAEILQVLALLRDKLPDLDCKDEEFVELYPLESSTWTVGSSLHRWIEAFSYPEFTARAAESVKRRPAPSLFALNDMFSLYEPQLRKVEALEPSFEAYDWLVAEALPRLGQSQRLWGRLALQSIFMHTVAGISADVKTIANSVLLYDLHGGGSAYEMMAAVLQQLETLNKGQLVATGSGMMRRYSLVPSEREALMVVVSEMADAIDADEAAAGLLSVGGGFFADWPFASGADDSGRLDLWEIEQGEGWVALEARTNGEGESSGEPPRLLLFVPGRPWYEANEQARKRPSTACWIGAMPTPAELDTIRKGLAAMRLAKSEQGRRFADLPGLSADLDAQMASIFYRVYVENGTLVTAERSDAIIDLVHATREENLVVRLMPAAGHGDAAAPDGDALWAAHLLASDGESAEALATEVGPAEWMQRLESWYSARVARDDAAPLRLLGEQGAGIREVGEALDAKQLLDAAIHRVRRALSAGSIDGLGAAIEELFETTDRLADVHARVAWLDRLTDWIARLDRAGRYLSAAETVDAPEVEALRAELLDRSTRIDQVVDARRRDEIDGRFADYREQYSRLYCEAHDATVGTETIDRLGAEIVSSEEWSALEALSELSIGTQSHLVDAINLMSVLRGSQCPADAATALAEQPICSCGFRFSDRERIDAIATNVRALLSAGVDHHRHLLQARRNELRDKLIASKRSFSIDTMRAIADLTKIGPLPVPILPTTVEAINTLLEREDDEEWSAAPDVERATSRAERA